MSVLLLSGKFLWCHLQGRESPGRVLLMINKGDSVFCTCAAAEGNLLLWKPRILAPPGNPPPSTASIFSFSGKYSIYTKLTIPLRPERLYGEAEYDPRVGRKPRIVGNPDRLQLIG